jgi:hypothetical protein
VGERKALVQINRPINLAEYLDAYEAGSREAVSGLTASFESTIQAGLSILAECNTQPGAQLF